MEIHFTKHANEKFAVLARHGVQILKKKVIETVANPSRLDHSRKPLLIAQIDLDKEHVLRVVYKIHNNVMHIITFYPGRKKQYEKKH